MDCKARSAVRPKKVRVKVCGVRRGKICDGYRHVVGRPGHKDTGVFLQRHFKAIVGVKIWLVAR